MILDAAEVVTHFLHYAAVTILFGVAWFFRQLPVEHRAEGSRLRTLIHSFLMGMVIFAVASGLGWFAFTIARISQTVSAAVDPGVLVDVLRETDFGPLWAMRMLVAILLLAVLVRRNMHPADLCIGLSAALLASLALTGHARSEEGVIAIMHVIADGLHLIAAGLWFGGLFGLLLVLGSARPAGDNQAAIEALRNFGAAGSLAVGTLLATGAVNTVLLVGAPSAMVSTSYGRLLLCKLAFFIGVLAVAAANRFALVPHLWQPQPMRMRTLSILKRHVLIEQIAGLSVLMIVSVLGASAPPASL